MLCALFHLEVWLQTKSEPAKIVYSYPPAIVERYIELGKIPSKKNPSTLERVKRKWPAAIVLGMILGAVVYFVNGSRSFLNGFLISYGLWLIAEWYGNVALKDKTKKSEKHRVYRAFMASPARFERAAFRLGAAL